MTRRRRHTPDQIIRKLAEGKKRLGSGTKLDEVCRHLEITESTWHRWVASTAARLLRSQPSAEGCEEGVSTSITRLTPRQFS